MRVLSTIAYAVGSKYAFDVNQAEQLLAGLIYGLIQKDDLAQIQVCLTDAEKVDEELSEAVTDFMKGDVTDIIKGVEMIGTVLQQLPTDLADCQNMQGDIARIEKWAAIFTDPKALVETVTTNLIKNFQVILGDITKASSDFSGADYYDGGADIADIMVETLGAVPELQPEDLKMTQW